MRTANPLRVAAAAALAIALAACARDARLASAPPTAPVNRPHEVSVALDAVGPAERAVHAEIVAPSGRRVSVPAFSRGGALAMRFRPEEPGRHAWRVLAGDGTVDREIARGEVRAVDAGLAGGVRARGGELVDAAGRTFRPLGESRFNVYDPTWSDGLGPEAYVARMASDGMNTLRVFVFTACGGPGTPPNPGCLEPVLGRFDDAAAERYDEILAAAERHGVKVILSVFAIGFTPGDAWKGWEANPYAAARGGPALAPEDFFEDPQARDAARRRLRYVLARWGASPALLAIDLLNEPEWDGAIPESAWIPWARDLARTWRALDPYGHPVTVGSVGLHWDVERDERPWWESGECEVVQWHRYGPDVYDVHALAKALVGTIRDTARYGKPVLLGEFGWGADPAPRFDHTLVGIWASTFAGAGVLVHSAPPFTIDSDAPMTVERARPFRALSALLARAEARGPLAPAPDPQVSLRGARALALAGDRVIAVWLHAPAQGYGGPVTGARVRVPVPGDPDGHWRVSWIDDTTGLEVGRGDAVASGGVISADAPPFVRHVAALLERADPPAIPARVQARAAR